MRLSVLDYGHRRRARLFLAFTSKVSRVASPDIVKMLLYRPEFLTRPLLDLTAPAMRGESYWTAGEREYLAMSTAEVHECPFCIVTHAELTRIAGHGEIDPDHPAGARPELLAVRGFLQQVSRTAELDPAPVRDLPDQAVLDALRVNLVWNIVNRLANAFGYELLDGQLKTGTRALHRAGYRFPGFLLGEDHGDLRASVFDRPAHTSPELRRAAAAGDGLEEPWRDYAALVRDASHQITDGDVRRLIAAGRTEDEIFEVTVAAAVGAALRSFDAGRDAVSSSAGR
jgi:AhpD family alkylhydroperoxidase